MMISIIIVTYNSLGFIKECLDSALNSLENIVSEIIIVDNSPLNIAKEMESFLLSNYKDDVKYIHNSKNLGYGYGNNIGIRESKGDIICIMNPDIVITHKKIFEDAIAQFHKDVNLGMLGYKQLGGKNLSFYFRQEFFLPVFSAVMLKLANFLNIFNSRYMYLSGALFFTKKDVFKSIGDFDESFFLYNEESDITKRFLMKGYTVKYMKRISYLHNIGDRGESSYDTFKLIIDSAIKYLEKYKFNQRRFLIKLSIELRIKYLLSIIMKKRDSSIMYISKIKCLSEKLRYIYIL